MVFVPAPQKNISSKNSSGAEYRATGSQSPQGREWSFGLERRAAPHWRSSALPARAQLGSSYLGHHVQGEAGDKAIYVAAAERLRRPLAF